MKDKLSPSVLLPSSISSFTIPKNPLAAARWSGRSPTSPLAFASAPNFISSLHTCATLHFDKPIRRSQTFTVQDKHWPARGQSKLQCVEGWRTPHLGRWRKPRVAREYQRPWGRAAKNNISNKYNWHANLHLTCFCHHSPQDGQPQLQYAVQWGLHTPPAGYLHHHAEVQ